MNALPSSELSGILALIMYPVEKAQITLQNTNITSKYKRRYESKQGILFHSLIFFQACNFHKIICKDHTQIMSVVNKLQKSVC